MPQCCGTCCVHRCRAPAGLDMVRAQMRRCELCDLRRTTAWYVEAERFVILDCDSCDVPMAVLRAHAREASAADGAEMRAALAPIADAKYPQGWFFDDHMRQIPEHYHLHARPYPKGWKK